MTAYQGYVALADMFATLAYLAVCYAIGAYKARGK